MIHYQSGVPQSFPRYRCERLSDKWLMDDVTVRYHARLSLRCRGGYNENILRSLPTVGWNEKAIGATMTCQPLRRRLVIPPFCSQIKCVWETFLLLRSHRTSPSDALFLYSKVTNLGVPFQLDIGSPVHRCCSNSQIRFDGKVSRNNSVSVCISFPHFKIFKCRKANVGVAGRHVTRSRLWAKL